MADRLLRRDVITRTLEKHMTTLGGLWAWSDGWVGSCLFEVRGLTTAAAGHLEHHMHLEGEESQTLSSQPERRLALLRRNALHTPSAEMSVGGLPAPFVPHPSAAEDGMKTHADPGIPPTPPPLLVQSGSQARRKPFSCLEECFERALRRRGPGPESCVGTVLPLLREAREQIKEAPAQIERAEGAVEAVSARLMAADDAGGGLLRDLKAGRLSPGDIEWAVQ